MDEMYTFLRSDFAFLVHIGVIVTITIFFYIMVIKTMNRGIDRRSQKDSFDATNQKFIQRDLSHPTYLIEVLCLHKKETFYTLSFFASKKITL